MKFSKNALFIATLVIINFNVIQATASYDKTEAVQAATIKTQAEKQERAREIIRGASKPVSHYHPGHSNGLQSYPGKTSYPENTQMLPSTARSFGGNEPSF
jgi:hypothetical protein